MCAGPVQLSGAVTLGLDGVFNTADDLTPYFLTAWHCGITSQNDNSMVVYFDTVAGGFSDNSTIGDNADFGRGRVSSAANPLTYPFQADYALVMSPAFGGFTALFQLQAGGANSLVPMPTRSAR